MENVSIEDVDGDGPFAGVRPNAGGGSMVDDGEVLSVIGDNDVLHKDPTTDSVCEGDGTGLRGGEGHKVGGSDIIVGGGLMSNGVRYRYRPQMELLSGSDGSDAVCG